MASARATALFERLIDDDYVHEQLVAGARRLMAAYRRGRALRAEQAVQDQRLFDHVRAAGGSLTAAARRLAGTPEPEPSRRWRRTPVLLAGAGVLALVGSMQRAHRASAGASTGAG